MEVTFINPVHFRQLIGSISEVAETIEMYPEPNGIEIQSLDPSHICIVHGWIPKNQCEMLNTKNNKPLGIGLAKFLEILKMGRKEDKISLTSKGDLLKIESKGDKNNIEFKLRLVTTEFSRIESLDVDYECSISLKSVDFEKCVKNIAELNTSCLLRIDNNENNNNVFDIEFEGETGEFGKIEFNQCKIESRVEKKIVSKINSGFLSKITKSSKTSENITIKLNSDNNIPICFEFLNEDGFLRFYLSQMNMEEE